MRTHEGTSIARRSRRHGSFIAALMGRPLRGSCDGRPPLTTITDSVTAKPIPSLPVPIPTHGTVGVVPTCGTPTASSTRPLHGQNTAARRLAWGLVSIVGCSDGAVTLALHTCMVWVASLQPQGP